MDAADLAYAGVARQVELVASGVVSARELVEVHLRRIERIDSRVRAFRVVFAERAMAEAERAQRRDLPLLGVPIAIKDDVDVGGEVTAWGTRAYGAPARDDAEVVRRLRAVGATILGKTNVPELVQFPFTESSTWGATRNPWNLDRTPGGSSGGSAAAVAAGLAAAALGSDALGSIRIPAAWCGLFGLKPQRDRISLAPRKEGWHGMSVIGPLTRSVLDAALLCDAMVGSLVREQAGFVGGRGSFADAAARRPGGLRIAVSTKLPTWVVGRVDPGWRCAVAETADLLSGLGHEVVERDPDYGFEAMPAGLLRYLRGIHDDAASMAHPQRLERRTRSMARIGGLIPPALIRWSRARDSRLAARFEPLFDAYDVLITPTNAIPPPEVGRFEGHGALRTLSVIPGFGPFNFPWNVTGQPAAAVPAGFDSELLPRSVQLVGRPGAELTILSLAAELEAARPWGERRPPVDGATP